MLFPDIPSSLQFMAVVLAGLVFGSFATMVVYRTPFGLSWLTSGSDKEKHLRSACPSCNKSLKVFDLVPVFSWLFLKGRCRYCSRPIASVYPLTEAMVVAGFLGLWLSWGAAPGTWFLYLCIPFLVAATMIDFKYMILPDKLNLILAVLGLAHIISFNLSGGWAAITDEVFIAVLSSLIFAGIAYLMRLVTSIILKKEALGLGDVKFFAVAGLWLDPILLPDFLLFSGVYGIVLGSIWRISGRGSAFPFGPALILCLYQLLIMSGLGVPALSVMSLNAP